MYNHTGIKFMAPPRFWMRDYNTANGKAAVKSQDKIVIIPIRGVLDKRPFFSDETGLIDVKRNVRAAAQDEAVKGILLSIDSPGGSVDGLGEAADEIFMARQIKPVFAYVDGMAASAAYWLASQATMIFSGPHHRVGSIGVYTVLVDDSKWAEDMGAKFHLVTTGEHKGVGTRGQEITDAQLEHLQDIVNTYYGFFLEAIERGRSMSREQLLPLADGRIFIGQQGVDNGLVDGIQSFEKTLTDLARSATPSTSFGAKDELELLALTELEIK
jgi:signal peptide peptidase SppA